MLLSESNETRLSSGMLPGRIKMVIYHIQIINSIYITYYPILRNNFKKDQWNNYEQINHYLSLMQCKHIIPCMGMDEYVLQTPLDQDFQQVMIQYPLICRNQNWKKYKD